MTHVIQVVYFAAARDLSGCAEERVEIGAPAIGDAALRELLAQRHARLAALLPRMRLALNDELCPAPFEIRAGDSVAVLPPVAGGMDEPGSAPALRGGAGDPSLLRDAPLSVDEVLRAVMHPGAGGVVIFLGVVRDHAEQGAVSRLDYEAHPSLADKELRRVLAEIAREHPGTRVHALHRFGELAVGDVAVVVAASAPHRAEAFAACRAAIDRIKETVPIWKKEWSPNGEALWVNLEPR